MKNLPKKLTPKEIVNMISDNMSLKAQLTDALETIRQNRLTIERMNKIILEKSESIERISQDQDGGVFREIALNLSRHLSNVQLTDTE